MMMQSINKGARLVGPVSRIPAGRAARRRTPWVVPCLLLVLASTGACSEGRAAEPVNYTRDVKPVLSHRCYSCHGALKQKGGLRVDTGESIRKGGEGGAAVEPGKSAESLLIELVTAGEGTRMPPEGEPLSASEIAHLRRWI
ncbi:c-type cytochrome domain-containing protein, partial [Singulisphaera rosea]